MSVQVIHAKTSGRIFKQLCRWNETKSWVNAFLMLYKRQNGEEGPQLKYRMNKINQNKVRQFALKRETSTAIELTWLYCYFYAILRSHHPVPHLLLSRVSPQEPGSMMEPSQPCYFLLSVLLGALKMSQGIHYPTIYFQWHFRRPDTVGMIEAPAAFLCNYPVSLLGLKLLPCKRAVALLPRKSCPNTNLLGCHQCQSTYPDAEMVFFGCWGEDCVPQTQLVKLQAQSGDVLMCW